MERALIYARVSTEEQASDERHSLKTQRRLCQKFIEECGHLALSENGVYEDAGKSGTNMNRPALQDMLLRIQEDKSVKAVIVQDTDRIARNASDHLTIKALLQKNGVEVISVSQPGITNSPEGNFMDLVIAGVNQLQSQITARKTMKSLEQKFWDGWWPTLAPIGYINSGDENDPKKRIITIDEQRVPLIKALFKKYATAVYSTHELRDEFYKKGLTSKAGKRIALSKIIEMIKNPFYYGEMRWRDLIKKGNHKPIISKNLFLQCQRVMAEHNRFACRKRKHNFLLRGFMFCAKCGQRMTAGHVFKKNKAYYHCSRAGDRIKCDEKYVEVWDLEKQVENKFQALQFSEEFINRIVGRAKSLYSSQKAGVLEQKKALIATKSNLERKLEIVEEKLFSHILSDEDFTRVKNKYRSQIETIEDEINKLERSKNIKVDIIQQLLALIRDIGKSYKTASPELKRVYLGLFWERFNVLNKQVAAAIPSRIVQDLVSLGSMNTDKTEKPIPFEHVFALGNAYSKEKVKISMVRGA